MHLHSLRSRIFTLAACLLVFCVEAGATAYFCTPRSIEIGDYRSPNGEDQNISIRLPDLEPFWFDDVNGDYLPYRGGDTGDGARKIEVPPEFSLSEKDRLQTWVAIAFRAEQCVEAEFGVVPLALRK
jgi:hypothetical protein